MKIHKNKFCITTLSVSVLSAIIFSTSTFASSGLTTKNSKVVENTFATKENYVLDTIDNLSDISICDKTLSDIVVIIPTQAKEIVTDENNQLKLIAPKGQEVFAPVSGTITQVVSYAEKDRDGLVPTKGFGSIVIIQDQNGNTFMLSHLGSLSCKQGEVLEAGDIIGTTGTTGRANTSMVGLSVRFNNIKDVSIEFETK